MGKEFIWLIDSQKPRTGPILEKGKTHKASDYPSHVVEYWIKTKVAKWVGEKEKSEKKEKE